MSMLNDVAYFLFLEMSTRSNNEKRTTSVSSRDAYLRWVSGYEWERDRDRREH